MAATAAATAPTFAAQGSPAFCAPARIKILLVPGANIEESEFERWASFVRNVDTMPLRDVPRTSRAPPAYALREQGEVHLSFVTSYDPSHAYLAPFQLHRAVLGVLGLTTYRAGGVDLQRVPGLLRAQHPGALVHRVFAFDTQVQPDDGDMAHAELAAGGDEGEFDAERAGFAGRRDGGLLVFPAVRRDAKDVRFYLRTLLAEYVGGLLDALDTLVGGLDEAALETPRPTMRGGLAAASAPASPMMSPSTSAPPPLPPRTAAAPVPSAAAKMFSLKRRTSAPPPSVRHTKVRGDAALLSGYLWDALEHYDTVLTHQGRERALAGGQDAVWFAGALEGWAVARMLTVRLGGDALLQAPCAVYPFVPGRDPRDKEPHDSLPPELAWRDITEAYSLALTIYAKCLAPPHMQLELLRSVTNETPRDYTPPLVHATACLAYARFLLALWSSSGWNAEAYDQLLYGGTPPALMHAPLAHAAAAHLSATSGVYRHEIAAPTMAAFTPSFRVLGPADQITVLAGAAHILGLLGFARQHAHVARLLGAVIAGLFAQTLHRRAQTPLPDASLSRADHALFSHTNAALVLGLIACDAYGIDVVTCPVAGLPASHALERARRRLCVATFAGVLSEAVGTDAARALLPALSDVRAAHAPFGWTALQVQLLQDLVVQSEALNDYVAQVYFAALLLRDFATALAPDQQRALLDGLGAVLPRARAHGAPHLMLRYAGSPRLVAALELCAPPAATLPVQRTRAAFAPPRSDEGVPGLNNPFVMQTMRSVRADAASVVADEPMAVHVTLRNVLGAPLALDVALDVAGVPADAPSVHVSLPPQALHTLRLHAVPHAAGRLEVRGCCVTLAGAERVAVPVESAVLSGHSDGVVRTAGLAARPAMTLVQCAAAAHRAQRDIAAAVAGTSPAAPLVCHVLPAQPRLTAALPLRHAALGLRSGSTVTVPLHLTNSSAHAIDFVRVTLDDSVQGAMRDAIVRGGLLPGNVHELEWQLLHAPVLTLPADTADVALAPRDSCTVPVTVRARNGVTWAKVVVWYGATADTPADAPLLLRTCDVVIPISVEPSIEVLSMDVSESQSAPMDGSRGDGAAARSLVTLDLRNEADTPLRADVCADGAPAASRVIPACTTTRVAVPLPRFALDPAAQHPPIPKLSPRQFIVPRTKFSPEAHAEMLAQFWTRDELLRRVRATWMDVCTGATGELSLRGLWPTPEQVTQLCLPPVRVTLDVSHHATAEQLTPVSVRVHNASDAPLHARMRLEPFLLGTERAASATTHVIVANGSWASDVFTLASGACIDIPSTLCFLATGTVQLAATVFHEALGPCGRAVHTLQVVHA